MSIQKKFPTIEEIPMDIVNSLITDNAYTNNMKIQNIYVYFVVK